jgi:hypothetical protein
VHVPRVRRRGRTLLRVRLSSGQVAEVAWGWQPLHPEECRFDKLEPLLLPNPPRTTRSFKMLIDLLDVAKTERTEYSSDFAKVTPRVMLVVTTSVLRVIGDLCASSLLVHVLVCCAQRLSFVIHCTLGIRSMRVTDTVVPTVTLCRLKATVLENALLVAFSITACLIAAGQVANVERTRRAVSAFVPRFFITR